MKRIIPAVLALVLCAFLSSCSSTSPFVSETVMDEELELSKKLEIYGGVEVGVNLPDMYFRGEDWMHEMETLLDEAEDYILLSTFLGSSCPSLEPIFQILERKVEEGVRVYFIIDGISSLDMTDSRYFMTNLIYLKDKGVNLFIYSPLSFTHLINPAHLLVRDHRKMMVVDGKIAAIGGMNINYISMGSGEKNQRDSMYVFRSASISSLFIDEFIRMWNEGCVDTMDSEDFKRYEDDNKEYKAWLFNRNVYSNSASISGMYASLIEEAKESIFLCPYLPTVDGNMKSSLKRAVDRGVDVEVWCSQDSRGYAKAGSAWAVANLIGDTGVEFHDVTYSPNGGILPMFHMKVMVVDNRYVVVGSSNFNYRSMTLSHEIGLVIDSPEMAEEVKREVLSVAGEGIILDEDTALANKRKYGSFLAYIFSYYGG